MIRVAADVYAVPLAIASEHGPLHGELAVLPGTAGLVVVAHASEALDPRARQLSAHFRQLGLSTLAVDLVSRREERYADVRHNVPLLARRLLEFLALIKNRMRLGELEPQALGLYAFEATSPVVIRVAALRDHDIAAIVCHGGLIDLAGMLYLRTLESPLLLLVDALDAQQRASNERALGALRCTHQLELIPGQAIDFAPSAAGRWFVRHFARPAERPA